MHNKAYTSIVMATICATIFAVSGCRTIHMPRKPYSPRTSQNGEAAIEVSKNTATSADAPAISRSGSNVASAVTDAARLRPGLVINVMVLVSGKKEIEATGKRITDKATIAMPLLGTVSVNDMTLEELSSQLTASYKEYFVSPQVIVEFVRDDNKEGLSPWGSVTVLGRVKKPGRVSLPATRDLSLSGAIQQAGGFDTSAKDSAIRITRRLSGGGGVKTWEVDLRSVGAKGLVDDDIILEPDDVVFVPELIF